MDLTWRNFWFESKAWVSDELGILRDQAHVHMGLCIFLLIAILLRSRRYGVFLAWLVVAVLQATNEAFDARDWINWTGSVNWGETAKDSLTTLFWPTILLLTWRWIGRQT